MRSIFHVLIIATALLTLTGCGFKADPFYEAIITPNEQSPLNYANAEFLVSKEQK